jgi:hypothetical protein
VDRSFNLEIKAMVFQNIRVIQRKWTPVNKHIFCLFPGKMDPGNPEFSWEASKIGPKIVPIRILPNKGECYIIRYYLTLKVE